MTKHFIQFKEGDNLGIPIINVLNHKCEWLGYIYFREDFKKFKQYEFTDNKIGLTEGCMSDILNKLKELNQKDKRSNVEK